jgi:hypothetical protein
VPTMPAPSRRGSVPLLYQAPCALAPAIAVAVPSRPPAVRIPPKALRAPKRHR